MPNGDRQHRFAGVILAAGAATRMGVAKPALSYGSSTMVSAVVDAAKAAGLSPVVVVTGFHEDAVAEAVGGTALLAHNPNPDIGNVSSLIVGMDAVPDTSGLVLLLADIPGVQSEAIVSLVDGMVNSGCLAGWIEYRDGRGHPVAIGRGAFDAVRGLEGSKALWPFLSSLASEDTFVVDVLDPRPTDVNTPQDYESVIRSLTPDEQR